MKRGWGAFLIVTEASCTDGSDVPVNIATGAIIADGRNVATLAMVRALQPY